MLPISTQPTRSVFSSNKEYLRDGVCLKQVATPHLLTVCDWTLT